MIFSDDITYRALHTFPRNIDLMSPKSRKRDKIFLMSAQIFRFSRFCLWPFDPTGIKIGSTWPQHVFKHAEMQRDTRRAKFWRSQCGEACLKIESISLKLKMNAMIVFFRTRYNLFVGLE